MSEAGNVLAIGLPIDVPVAIDIGVFIMAVYDLIGSTLAQFIPVVDFSQMYQLVLNLNSRRTRLLPKL